MIDKERTQKGVDTSVERHKPEFSFFVDFVKELLTSNFAQNICAINLLKMKLTEGTLCVFRVC